MKWKSARDKFRIIWDYKYDGEKWFFIFFLSCMYFDFLPYSFYIYGKNGFAEVSKNLARYRSENNFVRLSKLRKKSKHEQHCKKMFNILATSLCVYPI